MVPSSRDIVGVPPERRVVVGWLDGWMDGLDGLVRFGLVGWMVGWFGLDWFQFSVLCLLADTDDSRLC